jgi:hypothetical protein
MPKMTKYQKDWKNGIKTLYSVPSLDKRNIRKRWARHLARVEIIMNGYKSLVGILEGEKPL